MNVASAVSFVWNTKPDFPALKTINSHFYIIVLVYDQVAHMFHIMFT